MPSVPALAIVLTTVATRADARRLGGLLLEARLAACVQEVPIRSRYRWKGRVAQASEWLLLVKTRAARVRAVCAALRRAHPYAVPELLAVRAGAALPAYARWVETETRPPPRRRAKGAACP